MTIRLKFLLFISLLTLSSLAAAAQPDLFQAIRNGVSTARIAAMLHHGAKVNLADEKGRTPLMAAALTGRKDVANLLLKQGARVNVITRAGTTPLMTAVMGGHPDMVTLMLEHQARLEDRDSYGRSALIWATLLTNPAFPAGGEVTPADRMESLKLLLAHGADVRVKLRQNVTALMLAASGSPPEAIALLVKHGAEVNEAEQGGMTALMVAAQAGDTENVRELLKHGAKPRAKSAEGKTALDYAVANGHPGAATLLAH